MRLITGLSKHFQTLTRKVVPVEAISKTIEQRFQLQTVPEGVKRTDVQDRQEVVMDHSSETNHVINTNIQADLAYSWRRYTGFSRTNEYFCSEKSFLVALLVIGLVFTSVFVVVIVTTILTFLGMLKNCDCFRSAGKFREDFGFSSL